MIERVLILSIYFGAGLALLFCVGQFARPGFGPRRLVLALFLTTIGAIQLHAGLYHSGDIRLLPHFFLINVPALFFCGPLMAAYLRVVGEEAPRFGWREYLHLAPGVASTLWLGDFFSEPAAAKNELITATLTGAYPASLRVIFSLALASALAYSLYGLRVLYVLLKPGPLEPEYRRPLWVLFLMFCAVGLLANTAYFLRSTMLLRLTYASLTLILVVLHLFSLRTPDLMLQAGRELRRRRSELFRLRGVDLDAMRRRLVVLMEEERLYRDDSLGIDELAARLQVSSEQLSQFLNKQLGKNFHSFTNEYRVREAGELLRAEPKRTVLSIAYAVGFNSSSAFHEQFRRFTGQSPGKFRKGGPTADGNPGDFDRIISPDS